jgi:RNA polymerase sigma factor (sigma-70 family)
MAASEGNPPDASRSLDAFPLTQWSVVIEAARGGSERAEEALERLCKSYWRPLNAFVRHKGYTVEQAADLTQEFFARLIRKDFLEGITQEGGKFRSYLLTALKRFLASEWHRQNAEKRGGGQIHVPFDDGIEAGEQAADDGAPDLLFDQEWARAVMEQGLSRLRDEYLRDKKQELFQHIQGCLSGAETAIPYGAIALALQTTEAALRVAVHRMRRRYGELLRAAIAETVMSPAEIDGEIHYLIRVRSQRRSEFL